MGYLSGRWIISLLARRYSGLKSVIVAELGMIVTIVLLLIIQPLVGLYILSFFLGIFTRGTSPPIKAMAFDSLDDHQVKQGSAFHVLAGDSGSALAQLIFGLLVAWFGATAPFIAGALIAGFIAIICFTKEYSLLNRT
jgi:predicted MFS family arabinose efflux permease